MKERAARIQKLIAQSGKTYQELEKDTGIKKSSLQRYASGVTGKIPLTAIEKLATAFSVSEAYLMWGEEKTEDKQRQLTLSELSLKKREFMQKVEGMTDAQIEKLEQILALVENTEQ